MKPALAPYFKPKYLVNYALWAVTLFLLSQRIPTWIANYKIEGEAVASFPVEREDGARQILPLEGGKQIIIFWATWCKPCELELSRFESAIKNNEIPANAIQAVSIGEDPLLVYEVVKKRAYSFPVFTDPQNLAERSLPIQGTPQIYHIDEQGKVAFAGMGVSPLTIYRAESFLKRE